jgi:hypothetical protein
MPTIAEAELRELYLERRLSLRQIAQLKGSHASTVRQRLIKANIPRRSVAEAKTQSPRRPFSEDNQEKAYLLGFRAGDLHVYRANHSPTSQTIVVACATGVAEQIGLIRELFSK